MCRCCSQACCVKRYNSIYISRPLPQKTTARRSSFNKKHKQHGQALINLRFPNRHHSSTPNRKPSSPSKSLLHTNNLRANMVRPRLQHLHHATHHSPLLHLLPTRKLPYLPPCLNDTIPSTLRNDEVMDRYWSCHPPDDPDPSRRALGALEAPCSKAWREEEYQCSAREERS